MIDRGIPRIHYPLFNERSVMIGEVTSGTMSPSLKKGIGMGYVRTAYAEPGTLVYVSIRDKMVQAGIVRLPFYTADPD